MLDGFEYNSNSSCHFLKEKEAEFSSLFFPLSHTHTHTHSFSLALLVEKKKKRKGYIEVVVLPAAVIFFCDSPFCRTERWMDEKKREKKNRRVHASNRTDTYFRQWSMYMRQKT